MNRIAMSVCFLISVSLVAGCGSKDKGATSVGSGDAKSSTALTAEMLRLQPEKDRTFEDRRFLVNKADKAVSHTSRKGSIQVISHRAFTISNKLDSDVHVIMLYTQHKKGPEMENSGAFGDELLPIKRTGDDMNMLMRIYPKQVWTPLLKGGAKAGETWQTVEGNLSIRSECIKAGSTEGDPGLAVVQIISEDNRPLVKRRWYFGNNGVMRLDLYGSGKGESAKYWIPLRQLICDDWKGDRSPLALGEIKSR